MSGYTTIVVGTDGSESSYHAVDRAATLANEAQATLVIVCAFAQPTAEGAVQAHDVLGGDDATYVLRVGPAEEVLRTASQHAAQQGAVKVEAVSLGGRPAKVLEQIVAERAADLLVIGNRGLNTLAGRMLGSVPQDVLRHVPVDVLIVHTT